MPANAGATHSPRQRRLRTFRNLNQRTSPVTPPRRHNPHHHVLHQTTLATTRRSAIVLKRVVLLFWHTLAHRPLAHRRLGPLKSFPSSSAMTARTPNPLFLSGPVIDAGGARAPSRDQKLAEPVFRHLGSPPFSGPPSPKAPDRWRQGRRPLPRRIRHEREASTPIASSCGSSPRRRDRPRLGSHASAQMVTRSVAPTGSQTLTCA